MTNQEAIEELEYAIELIKQDGKDWLDERDIPVLQMAISALQAQELSETQKALDTISRQAAIDTLCTENCHEEGRWCDDGDCSAVRRLKALPTCNQLATDCISRTAAIDALRKYIAVNKNPNHDARIWEEGMNCALTVIGALPSADRPTGKWLKSDGTPYEGKPDGSCWCSECGAWLVASDEYDVADNFCPHCGAKMEENHE